MDAFDEVKEPRRVRLISEIANQIGHDHPVDAGFWAFVWLADIEQLEILINYFKNHPTDHLKNGIDMNPSEIKTLKTWTTRDRSSKNQEIVGDDGEMKRKSAAHTESPSPTKLPRRPGDTIQGAEDVTRLSSDLRGASTRSRSSSPSKIPQAVPPSMVSPRQALPGTPAEPVSPKKKNPEAKRYGRSTIMADKRELDLPYHKGGDSVEVAHIYPFSLGQTAGTTNYTDFWSTLSAYWSPSKIKDWENVVIGQ
ncbi:hypothetical protein ASPVEDRAFT_79304 [Aspergillus versicolor CBS 583.65]|uniref:HNH nuclease domain-containing protein n=1 Tax=Aspergillus versicolor CBS 583.65 TaxID=1036611 RepID=A0A1L9P7Y2_ASPVE|nr:uncharacterized protein ASPVEDRAFT_79304 [Aspergillus versicolor CBS 583.65]OJI97602.1 hypothetical protein ASPVEDRAFT_79304 [Aspergillus versicolor CBS 583.65]